MEGGDERGNMVVKDKKGEGWERAVSNKREHPADLSFRGTHISVKNLSTGVLFPRKNMDMGVHLTFPVDALPPARSQTNPRGPHSYKSLSFPSAPLVSDGYMKTPP